MLLTKDNPEIRRRMLEQRQKMLEYAKGWGVAEPCTAVCYNTSSPRRILHRESILGTGAGAGAGWFCTERGLPPVGHC